jgi:hypothetical protein
MVSLNLQPALCLYFIFTVIYCYFSGHYIWRERDSSGGFFLRKSVSDASLAGAEWMEYRAAELGVTIQHMFNGEIELKIDT